MGKVAFRRVHGRIVPIKVNENYRKGAIAATVAANAIGGLTAFSRSKPIFFAGQVANLGLDWGLSNALTAKAWYGKGRKKERLSGFVKDEAKLQVVGWATFAAAAMATPAGRAGVKAGLAAIKKFVVR